MSKYVVFILFVNFNSTTRHRVNVYL